MTELMQLIPWLCVGYFIALNLALLLVFLGCMPTLWRTMRHHALGGLPQFYSGLEPPISVLVPAAGQGATVVPRVQSLLHLIYAEHELVVITDTSETATLEHLIRGFDLVPTTERFTGTLTAPALRGVYSSTTHENLRVVEVGPAPAAGQWNAGCNHARFPFLCVVPPDLILRHDTLHRAVQPFLSGGGVIASLSPIDVANDCELKEGLLTRVRLPRRPLPMLQIVESLRGAVFGRLGWNTPNAVLLTMPAFALLDARVLAEVDGFRAGAVDATTELVARLHRVLRRQRREYRIVFQPEAITARLAPPSLLGMLNERARWQRALLQSLRGNLGLLHPQCGVVGLLALPYLIVFVLFLPVAEAAAYGLMLGLSATHQIPPSSLLLFLIAALGLGFIVSATGVALEGIVLHLYRRPRQVFALLIVAALEQLGFRQLCALARLAGFAGRT